jgi:hypothetical protein
MNENLEIENVPSLEIPDWGIDSAEMAFSVISRYVDHAQISGMLIAVLASALGEERLKPIVQSDYWQGYLAGRRTLSEAKNDIDRLSAMIERLRAASSPEQTVATHSDDAARAE